MSDMFGAVRGRTLRISAILLAAVSSSAMITSPAHSQATVPTTTAEADFAIPPQPLVDALNAFSQATGIQAIYPTAAGSGISSPGVRGRMSAGAALSQLLAGTGLTFKFTGPQAITLEPAPQDASGAIQLGPVRVEGSDLAAGGSGYPVPRTDRAATDRSRSYRARAATVVGKIAQDLRAIPQSVTVVTRQRMDDQNIVSLEDALRQTTGVTAVTYNAVTSYFQVRGYPAEIQFDGIPSESASIQYAPQFDMAMYDRVEVLRGPSGLLQGQGSPAGTINLVRKRPHDTFGWAASLMGGSWNNFHGDIDITGPIDKAGALRARFVAAGEDRDYFTDKEHEKHGLLYGILEYDLTPSTTLTVSGAYEHQRAGPFSFGQSVYANGQFLDAPRSAFFGVDWSRLSWITREAYASLDQDFGGGWAAKASLNYRWGNQDYVYGYLNGPVTLTNGSRYVLQANRFENEAFGADTYIGGPVDLLGRTHHLLFGANYSWRVSTGGNGNIATTVPDIYEIKISERPVPVTNRSNPHIEQYGLYAQARVSLLDPLTIVLGGRLTNYSSKTRSGLVTYSAYRDTGDITGHFTPSAGIVFDITKNVTFYGSYASIFSSQNNMTFEGDLLRPRTGKQFEVGAKASLLDDTLNVSGALFNVVDNGRAFTDPLHPNFYIAAGKVRSRGAEAEISGEPLPGWSVFAGYTYLQTKFLKDPTNQGAIFDLEEPRHTLKLWNTYRIGELDQPGFQLGAGVRVMSKTTRGGPVQGAYAVVDAQVGYRLNDQWSATLSINNLLDKTYYTRVPSALFGFYGAPRNFTLTLRKGF